MSLPRDFATALLRQCRRLPKGTVPAAASAESNTSYQHTWGLLMPDATLPAVPATPPPGMQWAGPVLCAELKPKCGWLPRIEVLPPGHEVKARVPKFQLQQAVKLAKVGCPQLSGPHCPACNATGLQGCQSESLAAPLHTTPWQALQRTGSSHPYACPQQLATPWQATVPPWTFIHILRPCYVLKPAGLFSSCIGPSPLQSLKHLDFCRGL